ncbi:MAG: hypothetical protein FWD48_08595 [Oscillospiraceae bacterium]|nr:hypothetical protein [Oscillospiraceae bacterium]
MRLKKLLAVLVVCAIAAGFMVIPASAKIGNSNFGSGGQDWCARPFHGENAHDLTKEDTMKIFGIEFIINVTSPLDGGFGGRVVINDNVGGWRTVSEWGNDGADKAITATLVEGTTYSVRFWSRTVQLFTAANWATENVYIEMLIASDWGDFNVVNHKYLDNTGAEIARAGGGTTAPEPEKPSEPAAPAAIVEFDGTYKTSDALNILRIAAGLLEATDDMKKVYDLNGDGEINTADAVIILRIAAGLMEAPCLDDDCDDDHDH